jgi:hypothetical protein
MCNRFVFVLDCVFELNCVQFVLSFASGCFRLPLASSPSVETCIAEHRRALERLESESHICRFLPFSDEELTVVPVASPHGTCSHKVSPNHVRLASFACGFYSASKPFRGAGFVWRFDGFDVAFLAPWSYRTCCYVINGSLRNDVEFFLDPVTSRACRLVDLLAETPGFADVGNTVVTARSVALDWNSSTSRAVLIGEASVIRIDRRKYKPKMSASSAATGEPLRDVEVELGVAPEEFDLDDALGLIIEEEALAEGLDSDLVHDVAEEDVVEDEHGQHEADTTGAGAADCERGDESDDGDRDDVGLESGPTIDLSDGTLPIMPVIPLVLTLDFTFLRKISSDARRVSMGLRRALAAAREEARALASEEIMDADLSLVTNAKDGDDDDAADADVDAVTTLVYWVDVAKFQGRRVGLNNNRTIKALFHGKVPVETFAPPEWRVLISVLPVSMKKARASHADRIPDWCDLLWAAANSQSFSGPLALRSAKSCLVCCALFVERREELGLYGTDSMYQCCECTGVFHIACAQHIFGFLYKPKHHPFLCPFCSTLK